MHGLFAYVPGTSAKFNGSYSQLVGFDSLAPVKQKGQPNSDES